MENLQTEVQEMEFIKFSKGLNVMRKEDFAEWLLYFTDEENNEIYWQNVKDRIEAGEVGTQSMLCSASSFVCTGFHLNVVI